MWRGPWKCEKCGAKELPNNGLHQYQRGPYDWTWCGGHPVPYDRRAVSDEIVEEMARALAESLAHHEYCGWGDRWERECADEEKLPDKIESALSRYRAASK